MNDQPTIPDFIDVSRYRHDHGHQAWAWRCWGTGDCDGWLSLDHFSQESADRSARKHLDNDHPAVAAALSPPAA